METPTTPKPPRPNPSILVDVDLLVRLSADSSRLAFDPRVHASVSREERSELRMRIASARQAVNKRLGSPSWEREQQP